MKTDYALVIGIDDYTQEEGGLTTLQGARKDALKFARWLRKSDGGGIEKSNCHLIISRRDPLKPLRPQVDKELGKIIKKAKDDKQASNRLYFYFAGHGLSVEYEGNGNAGLCLANWSEYCRRAALSAMLYQNMCIEYGLFREIVFFADCCRDSATRITPLGSEIEITEPRGEHKPKLFIGYATRPGHAAVETENDDGNMGGVFTRVLIEGLKGGAANVKGIIDAVSLENYLKKNVPANSPDNKQRPQIINGFEEEGQLVFQQVDPNSKIMCQITLKLRRKGSIVLMDGDAEEIRTFDAGESRKIDLALPKGTYLLEDRTTGETLAFEVNPFLSGEMIAIEF